MPKVFTIGHSNRTLDELVAVLEHYGIQQLVDIRHLPASRHNPQFNREELEKALPKRGITYIWLEQLGGFRKGGYVEYTKTKEFTSALKKLETLAKAATTAYMCAELLWFRCHRRHVSDLLAQKGWTVTHIFDENRMQAHPATLPLRG